MQVGSLSYRIYRLPSPVWDSESSTTLWWHVFELYRWNGEEWESIEVTPPTTEVGLIQDKVRLAEQAGAQLRTL